MQENYAPLSDRLRAKKVRVTDNNFAGAKNIGRLAPLGRAIDFRARGSVGKTDAVDFYRFTVQPGANFPTNRVQSLIKGAPVKLSIFIQSPGGKPVTAGEKLFKAGRSDVTDRQNPTLNSGQRTYTVFLKVSRVGNKTGNYDFRLTYLP
jgi:hypothetical protein